jgi:hypothetical protein
VLNENRVTVCAGSDARGGREASTPPWKLKLERRAGEGPQLDRLSDAWTIAS